MLAKLHRACEFTAVWVPDAALEVMRNLARERSTAVRVLAKARQHLNVCCVMGKSMQVTTVRFDHPAQQLQDYIHAVEDAEKRVASTRQIQENSR
jgi:transposase